MTPIGQWTKICLIYLINLTISVSGDLLPPIYWNASNPLFFYDYTLQPKIRDFLEFHCPFYQSPLNAVGQPVERSIIYRVSKFGYDNCLLMDEKPVGQCVTPFKETIIKLTLREFTPMPDGLEFAAGQTYYFISTSTSLKAGIHNRIGGLCETDKMRLKVYIRPAHTGAGGGRAMEYSDGTVSGRGVENSGDRDSETEADAHFVPMEKLVDDQPIVEKLIMNDQDEEFYRRHPRRRTPSENRNRLIQEDLVLYEIHETDDEIYPTPLYSKSASKTFKFGSILLSIVFLLYRKFL